MQTRLALSLTVLLAACSGGSATEVERTRAHTLVAGTLIQATMEHSAAWRRDATSTLLIATVTGDVRNARREVVIPAGSELRLRVQRQAPLGELQPARQLALDLVYVTVGGQQYLLEGRADVRALAVYRRRGTVEVVAPQPRMMVVLTQAFRPL